MKYISIDRFEGKFAICIGEDEEIIKVKIKYLPKTAKEGDILKVLKGFKFEIDEEKTKKRREEIFTLQEDLFEED